MSIYEYEQGFEEKKLRKARIWIRSAWIVENSNSEKTCQRKIYQWICGCSWRKSSRHPKLHQWTEIWKGTFGIELIKSQQGQEKNHFPRPPNKLFSLLPARCPSAPCILRSFFLLQQFPLFSNSDNFWSLNGCCLSSDALKHFYSFFYHNFTVPLPFYW